jgi:hypothetical protein
LFLRSAAKAKCNCCESASLAALSFSPCFAFQSV